MHSESWRTRAKNLIIGKPRNISDRTIFHKISLIAFFAWVGLGADGLSSSCYGPQEAFLALRGHIYLSIFVALATGITILVISSSYSQIVELFPGGGGGYLVASKLLNPTLGMVSGCALLIDYVLTIAVSIASGADAVFSLLPLSWAAYRIVCAVAMVLLLMVLNMRGVKESILPLVPIFVTFLLTHVFIITYALCTHVPQMHQIVSSTGNDIHATISQIGILGMIFLVLKAYSMGAGTYTGIEAVSNGVPVLREPKVHTAKITIRYMAISLAFMAMGLMLAYLLFQVSFQPGKTFNAILFEQGTAHWKGGIGVPFVFVALISEAALLFVAAQTGFIDGPRVLANMAKDRWFPARFSSLSDRFVVGNGILIMGLLAALVMMATRGSVQFLVILYSINVFITFVLSQSGMVRHWWQERAKDKRWLGKFIVNGIGLVMSGFILVSMVVMKFFGGGWITLFITAGLVCFALLIKQHYARIGVLLKRLNSLLTVVESDIAPVMAAGGSVAHAPAYDPKGRTAVLLVNGFNGMGLHTLFGVIRLFPGVFKNFVFLEVGVVDSGNFKGNEEIGSLKGQVKSAVDRYVVYMNTQGYYAQGISVLGVDVVDEIEQLAPSLQQRFPHAVFFGGQLIFPKDTFVERMLHNYTVFALQKRLYLQGMPFVIVPIRVE